MTEHNPNKGLVLDKNPYFHFEEYPVAGPVKTATSNDIKPRKSLCHWFLDYTNFT